MIRSWPVAIDTAMCIPRESGDDPDGTLLEALESGYSPRERG